MDLKSLTESPRGAGVCSFFSLRSGCLRLFGVVLAGLGASGCSLVPSHEIPVHEAYILAGVQVGDTVEVTMEDGTQRELVVTAVGRDSISGPGEFIKFRDIRKLVKYSWSEPEHPCGGGQPVGCSAPVLLTIAELAESATLTEIPEELEPACVAHDYCYRHGFATYGAGRKQCDQAFYDEMEKVCYGPLYLNVLDVKHFSLCMVAAAEINQLVRQLGEEAFLQEESTYCEYDLDTSPAARRVETHVVGGLLEDRPVGPRAEADH